MQKIELTSSSIITSIQDSLNLTDLGDDLAPYIPAIKSSVFVAYHDSSNNWLAIPWNSWTTTRTDAEAVVAIEGTHRIAIALDEATDYYWSSTTGSSGNSYITNKYTADEDFDGQTKTATIVASSTYSSDGAGYAPGYCHAYSTSGIAAGSWWLPSLGELGIIWKHFDEINAALARISGATQLTRTYYWSSTEYSASNAWHLYMYCGRRWSLAKTSTQRRVRPVTAF